MLSKISNNSDNSCSLISNGELIRYNPAIEDEGTGLKKLLLFISTLQLNVILSRYKIVKINKKATVKTVILVKWIYFINKFIHLRDLGKKPNIWDTIKTKKVNKKPNINK